MLQKGVLVEQSRAEVAKSNLNCSRSKQLWTFTKKQRFEPVRPQCPNAFYAKAADSTLSHKKVSFPNSIRKVFTEATDAPLPGTYNVDPGRDRGRRGIMFGESRKKCLTNSYIPIDPLRNPGPSDYSQPEKKKRGFSMRPKTPNERNYFIDNKERKEVPAPTDYNPVMVKAGKTSNSRLHSSILGWVGLMKKSPRFEAQHSGNYHDHSGSTPGPSSYSPNKGSMKSKSMGGCIGTALRKSFIDTILRKELTPGPGNYEQFVEFGRCMRNSASGSRMYEQ